MIGRLLAPVAVALADSVMLAAAPIDVNLLVNVAMIVVAAMVAWPVVKSRRMKESLAAADRREQDLQKDLEGAQKRADQALETCKKLEAELAAAVARYEEQSKYTAEVAVTQMLQQLGVQQRALEALVARLNGEEKPAV